MRRFMDEEMIADYVMDVRQSDPGIGGVKLWRMYVEETGRHVGVYYTIEALRMALCGAGAADLCGLIHHSDRGSRYASREYVSLLMSTGMMTPAQAEKCDGELRKMWHSYREEAIKNLKKARKQPISPKKVYLCIPVTGLLPGYALQSTHDRNKLT